MKAVIVFHSATGNTYLTAKAFYESFLEHKCKVSLYRVADNDLALQGETPEKAKAILNEMMSVPVVKSEDLLDADILLLGSPTYFGNVSAEMKAFMDSFAVYWFQAPLAGKSLVAFTSCGNPEGGADFCLQAIHIFGQHMGMVSVSVPVNLLKEESGTAYGVVHFSGAQYAEDLKESTIRKIKGLVNLVVHRHQ